MPNAIKMLQDDHNSIRILFGQIQQVPAGQADVEAQAALQVESMLTTHMALMHEFIVPVLAEAAPELAAKTESDHEEVGRLLDEVKALPGGLERRAALGRLDEHFKDHVSGQEDEVFPLITNRLGVVALEDLGREMIGRQQELMQSSVETTGAAETARTPGVHPKL